MGFNIIVAVDQKRGIGIKNDLPWRLKADMKWFKETTVSTDRTKPNAVIMGRKTWDSIPDKFRPLVDRINIVITRSPSNCAAPYCASNLDEALALAYDLADKVFVIGGASIYKLAFHHRDLDELFITEIDKDFNCDTFFPDYSNLTHFKVIRNGSENDLNYKIIQFTT